MAVRKLSEQTLREMGRGREVVARTRRDEGMSKAKADRTATMERWMAEGRLSYVPKMREVGRGRWLYPLTDPKIVTVQVGELIFEEPTKVYPTARMVARVALALQAGMDEPDA